MSSAQSRLVAAEMGLDVVVPDSRTLTLDVDNELQLAICQRQIERLEEMMMTSLPYSATVSPSGEPGHLHIYIDWPEGEEELKLDVPTRIAFTSQSRQRPVPGTE